MNEPLGLLHYLLGFALVVAFVLAVAAPFFIQVM